MALAWCVLTATPSYGQAPLSLINRDTEVRAIGYRFVSGRTFSSGQLDQHIALTSPGGLTGVRRVLSFLPIIASVPPYPFDPFELQRDVVRLRRFYRREGFPHASIRYDVTFDAEDNAVRVRFIIDEGSPVRLRRVRFLAADGETTFLPPDGIRSGWLHFRQEMERGLGPRFSEAAPSRAEARTRSWLGDRGFPFAAVRSVSAVDSLENGADVDVLIELGPRARVGEITVEGNRSVRDRVVVRQLPFGAGDWYSLGALEDARTELTRLDLIRTAALAVPEGQPADSTVAVRVRVDEARSRLIRGDLGYVSEGGLSQQVQWSHRNALGSAQTFTAAVLSQTGVLALDDSPDRFFRGSLSLLQPYVFHRRLSSLTGPFFEFRNDSRDRSWELGFNETLIYQFAPLRSLSLRYEVATRKIIEYRFGDFTAGQIDLLTLLALDAQGVLDTLGTRLNTSDLTLTGTLGFLDDPGNPTRGLVLRPSAGLAAPAPLTSNEFTRLDITVTGYYPLGPSLTLVGRFSAGRLFPFGKSIPEPGEDPAIAFLRLRDAAFTAGGTADVRGWGNRMLGPKFPDIRATEVDGDTVLLANGYVPVGGLARIAGTAEIRPPFPGLGARWGTHLFLDFGRVWSPDERFDSNDDPFGQTRTFVAVGGGIDVRTLIGPIRLSIGYKLNPSVLDLRPAGEVWAALQSGVDPRDIEDIIEANAWRRLHLHLSLGVGF